MTKTGLLAVVRPATQVILLAVLIYGVAGVLSNGPASAGFEERARHILLHESSKDRSHAKQGFHYAMARLALGRDTVKALEIVNRVTDELRGDTDQMFDYYPAVAAYLRYGRLYPPALRAKAAEKLMLWRGDHHCATCGTYNQQILRATTSYLIKQTWPDHPGDGPGARRKLLDMMQRIATRGMTESDSPTYHLVYVNALLLICELARERNLRERACLTVDALLANVAPQWLNGYWISANARDQNRVLSPDDSAQGAIMAWLYFGGARKPNLDGHPAEAYALVIPATSPYRVPEPIRRIARDRRRPFVHRESHAPDGAAWQPFTGTVRRYSYLAPAYGVASQNEPGGRPGVTWQLSRWFVRWTSDRPGSTFFMTVPSRKGFYYQGSAAFEETLQLNGTLLVVYRQPKKAPGFIDGPVSRDAVRAVIEDRGWIFLDGGAVLIAVRPVKPFEWTRDRTLFGRRYRNLRSRGHRNGVVIETAPRQTFAGGGPAAELKRFARHVIEKTRIDASHIDDAKPRLIFRNLAGDLLDITYGGPHRINGRAVDYAAWPLLENPWMKQDFAGRRLTIGYGGSRIRYDFRTWEKTRLP